jgi:hypothetical protein
MGNETAIRLSCDDLIDEQVKLREICLTNDDAYKFCVSYLTLCGLLDDIIDGDKPVEAEALIGSILNWTAQISDNKFWQDHREPLYALIVQASSSWLDSNYCAKSDKPQLKTASVALKSFYGEVIYHVAFLVGGYDHMRKSSLRWRAIDPE